MLSLIQGATVCTKIRPDGPDRSILIGHKSPLLTREDQLCTPAVIRFKQGFMPVKNIDRIICSCSVCRNHQTILNPSVGKVSLVITCCDIRIFRIKAATNGVSFFVITRKQVKLVVYVFLPGGGIKCSVLNK